MNNWAVEAERSWIKGTWGTEVRVWRKKLSLKYCVDAEHVSPRESSSERRRRGAITAWTQSMSRNLRHTIDNFRQDFSVMVTLTYPKDWARDGTVVKAHLKALVERLRRVGKLDTDTWVWWLEFQERGAPHIHAVSTGFIPKAWLAKAWAEITGGDERACSRVEGLKRPEAAGAYAAKYAAKQEQKQVPADYLRVGRFWGMFGRARADARAGVRPVPSLAAAIPRRSPGWCKKLLEWLKIRVRAYETPVGYVVYGIEKEVRRAFWALTSARSSATTGKESVGLRRPMQGGLFAT